MAYREVHGVEIQEIIRRWQAGLSQRRIASGTGLSRVTVRRYVEAAEAAGLTPGGPEPSEEQLAALATLSLSGPRQVEAPSEELLSPWAEQIERWLETDRLQLTRIQELLAGRGCEVSYTCSWWCSARSCLRGDRSRRCSRSSRRRGVRLGASSSSRHRPKAGRSRTRSCWRRCGSSSSRSPRPISARPRTPRRSRCPAARRPAAFRGLNGARAR